MKKIPTAGQEYVRIYHRLISCLCISVLLLIFHPLAARQQQFQVTGKVSGQNNEPLQGVSVRLRGTQAGTTTDAAGVYALAVPGDTSVLLFSYIGYTTQEVPVANRRVINVVLNSTAHQLDQIVVIGYGTQRKIDVTGATGTVKGAELAKQPVLTATQALQGKVAGVQIISSGQPGTSPVIRIRGINTPLGDQGVLFVVDGVITDDISNINTADIVNVDILKDASSSAIYGARGANGVMIITTKKGTAGKTRITYNGNVGVRQAANLVEMANAQEYANYASAASGLSVSAGSYSTDWYGEILRNAVEQQHSISLSGGAERATYFLSFGYVNDQGVVIDNAFRRFTVRSNNDFKLNDWIRSGITASFANASDDRVNLGTAYNNAYRAAPIIPAKVNGRYGNTSVYQNVGNPLLDIENNRNPVVDNRLQGSGYLEVKPVSPLTLRSSIGGDLQYNTNKSYTYKFLNDTSTFITFGGNQRNPTSSLNLTSNHSFHWVWDNTATFSKRFGGSNLTVLAGTTAESFNLDFQNGSRQDVPADPNLWYLSQGNANSTRVNGGGDKWTRTSYLGRVNYSLNDKYLLTGSVRADGSSRLPAGNRWGYYPSVGVGWVISREDFLLSQDIFQTLKLRGSWGKVGNDNIPSDAFTLTITQNLAYPFGGGVATPGSAITRVKDPNLKWEVTTESDVALEFAALRSRLTGEVNYYNKKSSDALIFVIVPAVAGDQTGRVLTNAASIENKGVEVSLNWSSRIRKFNYHIGGNLTLNKNNVVGLNGGQPLLGGGVASQSFTTKTDNGQPVGSFFLLKMIGIFQSDEEVLNYKNPDGTLIQPGAHAGDIKYEKAPPADGKQPSGPIDLVNDRQFVGAYQPKAYYGINGGFTYKNVDFSIDIYGNAGNQVYNGKKAFRRSDGGVDNVEKYQAYDRWTRSNGSQTEPAANKGLLPASTYFLESGSFVRINNATIGYNVSNALMNRAGITSLRVFVTGQNLYTYKKYSGFTAELPGGPLDSGIELNAYPTTRTVAIGINLGF